MKKQNQSIRFFLFAGLLIAGLAALANNNVMISNNLESKKSTLCFDETFSYSWAAEPGAVSYVVDMVNTVTEERFSWETNQTSITAFGVPSGTYDLTVTAKFADTSSSIIVEEMVEH